MAQGGGIEDWYRGLPKVTRGYMTAAMGTTVLVQLELLAPTLLFLDFEAVGTQLEVWRLMTNFVFFGGFGMPFCFSMLFLVRYGRELEAKRFEGRASDFLWCLMGIGLIQIAVAFVMGSMPFLSSAMLSSIVYLWSREYSEQVLNIFGLFQVQGFYFPWVLMAMHVLMGGSPIADLVGIGSGHCYYFATDVQGYELRAPSILRNFFDTQSPAQQRIANRQNAFGGHQWGGGGQRLGG